MEEITRLAIITTIVSEKCLFTRDRGQIAHKESVPLSPVGFSIQHFLPIYLIQSKLLTEILDVTFVRLFKIEVTQEVCFTKDMIYLLSKPDSELISTCF